MSTLFFTSDTHFFHKNIIKYCNRPFDDVNHMNEMLIYNWNKVVTNKDQIWHLGDFSFGDYEQTKSVLKQLRGHKHFVKGNHDKIFVKHKDLCDYFETVQDYKELKWEKKKLILFHFPIAVWNMAHRDSYHLCGHSHGSMNLWHEKTTSLDVGTDNFNYQPVSFEEIVELMKNRTYLTHDRHSHEF